MKFDIREGSSSNMFIMCTDYDFNHWKDGRVVFVKDPTTLNKLFKDMCIENTVLPNSFMPVSYLDMLPARACFERLSNSEVLYQVDKEELLNFAEDIPAFEAITLGDIWEIYDSIISQTSPFREELPEIPVKTRDDFKNKSLYDHIEIHNQFQIRFFSELFSTYSLLSMRPDYYDEDSLILNIFSEKFQAHATPDIDTSVKVYCLCWTSEY